MWYKKAEDYKKMKDWFEERTKKHIALVQKYCKEIEEYDDRFKGLVEQAINHDKSKFKDPEIDPYVYITWKYKCKSDGVEFDAPKDIDEKMNEATNHHVRNNSHHPECHTTQKGNLINEDNRDKPPDVVVDATNMPILDLAEMCADWMAVSEEKNSSPKDWADKNVNVRWKFTAEQKELIYELIDEVWDG
jgi:hypothetical protein